MKSRITIDIEEGLTPEEQEHVRLLFKDALYEFIKTRSNLVEYVMARYGMQRVKFKVAKMAEVQARLCLARKILVGVNDVVLSTSQPVTDEACFFGGMDNALPPG